MDPPPIARKALTSDKDWDRQVNDLLSFLDQFQFDSYVKRQSPKKNSRRRVTFQLDKDKDKDKDNDSAAPAEKAVGRRIRVEDHLKDCLRDEQDQSKNKVEDQNNPSFWSKQQDVRSSSHSNEQLAQIWKEAEEARETARRWARKMRVAVTQWLEHNRDGTQKQREEQNLAEKAYRDAIATLEDKIQRLQQNSKDSLERYLDEEEKLHQIIYSQQQTIQDLECRLRLLQEQKKQPDLGAIENPGSENTVVPAASNHNVVEEMPVVSRLIESMNIYQEGTPVGPKKALVSVRFEDPVLSSIPKEGAHTPVNTNTIKDPAMTPGEQSVPISPSDNSSLEGSPEMRELFPCQQYPTPYIPRELETTTSQSSPKSKARRRRLQSPKGHPIIQYKNGSIKEIRPDGTTIIRFANGDLQTTCGGSTAYYYSRTRVLSVSQPDGSTLWEFPNGQLEKHWPDGQRVVVQNENVPPPSLVMSAVKEELRREELDQLTVD